MHVAQNPGTKPDLKMVKEWLGHPVTKIVLLVIAAEVAYQAFLRKGVKLLGLDMPAE